MFNPNRRIVYSYGWNIVSPQTGVQNELGNCTMVKIITYLPLTAISTPFNVTEALNFNSVF
jgi:hypothetical protein